MARELRSNWMPALFCLLPLAASGYVLTDILIKGWSDFRAEQGTLETAVITGIGGKDAPALAQGNVSYRWFDRDRRPHDSEQEVSWAFTQTVTVGEQIRIWTALSQDGLLRGSSVIVGEEVWRRDTMLMQAVICVSVGMGSILALVWMGKRKFQIDLALNDFRPHFISGRPPASDRESTSPQS